jgi:hypothetical protein
MVQASLSGPALVRLLTSQRDVYQQLAELACQQSQFVIAGQAEELMTVLAARGKLIDELSALDRELRPHKPHWETMMAQVTGEERATIDGLMSEVETLLARILAQDEADKAVLVKQKADIGAQLQGTATGQQLNRAYGIRPKTPSPGFGIG